MKSVARIWLGTLVAGCGLLAVGAVAGCRNAPPSPPPQPPELVGPAQHFIADRKTRVYHRLDCERLPPAERRVQLDRRMLELTESLHTPCDVCKPAGTSGEAPTEDGPAPPEEGPSVEGPAQSPPPEPQTDSVP